MGLLSVGRDPGSSDAVKDERPGRRPRAWMQRALPLCTPARAVRSRGAFDRDYGAVTTTSGLWLRRAAYGAAVARAKSVSRRPRGKALQRREDLTNQRGVDTF